MKHFYKRKLRGVSKLVLFAMLVLLCPTLALAENTTISINLSLSKTVAIAAGDTLFVNVGDTLSIGCGGKVDCKGVLINKGVIVVGTDAVCHSKQLTSPGTLECSGAVTNMGAITINAWGIFNSVSAIRNSGEIVNHGGSIHLENGVKNVISSIRFELVEGKCSCTAHAKSQEGYCDICSKLPINSKNFPDDNFRAYLLENILHRDTLITKTKAESVKKIVTYPHFNEEYISEVKSLKGIEYFDNLESLVLLRSYGPNEKITDVNFSDFVNLKSLGIDFDTTINIEDIPNVKDLSLWYNDQVDIAALASQLKKLNIVNGDLPELDLSNCKELTYLGLTCERLPELDLTSCWNLDTLILNCESLSRLDLSKCVNLEFIELYKTGLSYIDVSKCSENLKFSTGSFTSNVATIDKFPCLFKLGDIANGIKEKLVSNITGVDTVLLNEEIYLQATGDAISYDYTIVKKDTFVIPFSIKAKQEGVTHMYYDKSSECTRCGEKCSHSGATHFCGICHNFLGEEIETIHISLETPKEGDVLESRFYDVIINDSIEGQIAAGWYDMTKYNDLEAVYSNYVFSTYFNGISFDELEKSTLGIQKVTVKENKSYVFYATLKSHGVTENTKVFINNEEASYVELDSILNCLVTAESFYVSPCAENHDSIRGYCEKCGNLPVNSLNFPDENLRTAIAIEAGHSLLLSAEVVNGIHRIASRKHVDAYFRSSRRYSNDYYEQVKDWSGLEYFTNIDTLCVLKMNNVLPTLPKLKWLLLENYAGDSLVLNECKDLYFLYVDTCPNLTSIELDSCVELTILTIKNAPLESLDVTNNPHLFQLMVTGTKLTEIDLSKNSELVQLNLIGTPIETLDLSENKELTYMILFDSPFERLDLSNNKKLNYFNIQGTALTALDLTNNEEVNYTRSNCIKNGMEIDAFPCRFKMSELSSEIVDERVVNINGIDSEDIDDEKYYIASDTFIEYTYNVKADGSEAFSFTISSKTRDTLHFFEEGVCTRCGTKEKVDEIVTSVNEVANNLISVYPNPASEVVRVNCANANGYQIVNLEGVIVAEGRLGKEVSVSHLPKGAYIVKVTLSDGTVKHVNILKK